jgi:hypothetical protein
MIRIARLLVLGLSCALTLAGAGRAHAQMTPRELQALVGHIEQTMFPAASVSSYRLTHLRGEQVLKTFAFEMTMKGDNSLLAMNWPATSKHKYLLKADTNLWMYFSDVRRSIRLSARDSFMGTDANNYDMMQLNLLKDYTIGGFVETELDGEPVVKVELAGKRDTDGYARIVSWISVANKRMVQNECYSISGQLIKTVRYGDYFEVDRYRIPGTVRILSNVNKGRSTVMEISKVTPRQPAEIRDSMFTLGFLETVD